MLKEINEMNAKLFITLMWIICLSIVGYDAYANQKICGKEESRWVTYAENFKETGHLNVVYDELEKQGLSQKFIWLLLVESGGKQDACSEKGASGLWQLTEPTANHYGCYDRTDPKFATRAAARYLQKLLKDFGGDEWSAIVGYNMGGTNYKKAGKPTDEAKVLADTVTCLMEHYGGQLP